MVYLRRTCELLPASSLSLLLTVSHPLTPFTTTLDSTNPLCFFHLDSLCPWRRSSQLQLKPSLISSTPYSESPTLSRRKHTRSSVPARVQLHRSYLKAAQTVNRLKTSTVAARIHLEDTFSSLSSGTPNLLRDRTTLGLFMVYG